MRRIIKEEKGFTLIIAIFALSLLSIFSIAIINVSASNYKMTKVDSKNQAAYYIAEAGVNKVLSDINKEVNSLSGSKPSHDYFFNQLDEYVKNLITEIGGFEENMGEDPVAIVTIAGGELKEDEKNDNSKYKIYDVISTGKIGDSKRTVKTSVKVTYEVEMEETQRHPAFDYVLYHVGNSSKFKISSSSKIYGNINTTGEVTIENGNNIIEGDIITGNHVMIKTSGHIIKGDINANGQVMIENDSNTVEGDINAGNHVMIKTNQNVVKGSINAEDKVQIDGDNNTVEGDINAGKKVEINGHNNTVKGKINEDVSNPIKPKQPITSEVPLHTFEIGNKDVYEKSNEYYISPGAYRNLILKDRDTVKITAGNYYFNSANSATDISLKLDLSDGPINIFAKENISFGDRLKVFVSYDGMNYTEVNDNFVNNNRGLAIELAGKVYWETYNNFSLSNDSYFLGTVLAGKNISIGHRSKLIGAYIANKGISGELVETIIIYAQPNTPAVGDSGDGGGQNIKSTSATIEVEPVKEI